MSLSTDSCFCFKILPSWSSLLPCRQTVLKTVAHMKKVPCHSNSPGYSRVPTVLPWGQTYPSLCGVWLLAEEVTEMAGGSIHPVNGQEAHGSRWVSCLYSALFLSSSLFSKPVPSSSPQVLLPQVNPSAARAYFLVLLISQLCLEKWEPSYYWFNCFIMLRAQCSDNEKSKPSRTPGQED